MINTNWFIAFIIWTVVVFGAGVYTEHKFSLAAQVGIADAQTKRAADGQAKIIDFNQKWSKASDKDVPCAINPAERKLLH